MLKGITTIVSILALLPLCGMGQTLPFNQYGNEVWLGDSINGLPAPNRFGFNYRPDNNLPPKTRLALPILPQDSNTYARLLYRITSARNQSLGARVYRPLSKTEHLEFNLQRVSNPGWMVSSESRYTYADLGLAVDLIDEKLRMEITGKAMILDRDQNGGLQSDTYNLADDAGAFGALNNDVHLSSAFNRSADVRVRTDLEYALSKKLTLAGIGMLKQQRFLYDDDRGDQSYYDAFRNDTSVSQVRDSNKVFIWSTGARASYVLSQEGAMSQKVHLAFLHHAIRYRSMEATEFTTNTTVSAQFLAVGKSTSLDVLGQTAIAGYNAGDIQLKGVLTHALSNTPSTDTNASAKGAWSAKVNMVAQRYEPYVIYSRYRSSYLNWTSYLTKSTAVDIAGGLVRKAAKGGAGFRLTSQWRDRLVYLNEDLEVTQSPNSIALLGMEVQGDVAAKGFELSGIVRYQLNVLSKAYDLPMLSASGEFSYAFPMFNKSIYIQAGAGASYFSDYRARAYAPFMDVYYLQRAARFGNYLQLDPFMRASVQTVDVTLRLINGAHGLFGSQALIAPGYPTIPRFLEIRIDWVFKN